MYLKKCGFNVLGLSCLAVLSLMAIAPVEAPATTGKVLVLGSTTLDATGAGEIDLLGALDVPAINLEIDCSQFTVESTTILASEGIGHGKVLIKGCLAYGTSPSLSLISECEIYPTAADRTAGTNKGHITAEALLLVLLHTGAGGSKTIVAVKPKEAGGLFTKIFFKNCPSGASADIKGEVDALFHTTGDQVKHLVEEASGSFKLHQLKYGANNANILGSLWVYLTGAHENCTWGII